MAAPAFLRNRSGAFETIATVPLISSTRDDWEWREWANVNAVDFARLDIRYRFDIDSPAILACNAGLGVMLMPDWMVDWEAGIVEPFGAYPQQALGAYWLSFDPRARRSAKTFVSWLLQAARETETRQESHQQRALKRATQRPMLPRSEPGRKGRAG
jgi:DNA-binding transcriptional LysR family regulator